MALSRIKRIREWINLRLFGHKAQMLYTLRILSFFVSLVAIAAIFYYHGFPQSDESRYWVHMITWGSLGFYAFKYILNIFYDFHPQQFIKNSWFEATLVLLIIIGSLAALVWGPNRLYDFFLHLGLKDVPALYIIFIQLYVFLMIGVEMVKASTYMDRLNIGPAGLLIATFLILIAIGAILLCLPEMTISQHLSPIDALFTSASAVCVTGLTVVDTATYFTFKGQFVILLLIQMGGINIVAFATFFAIFYSGGAGLRQQSLLKDLLSAHGLSDTRVILREIVYYSFTIEIIGAVMLYLVWRDTTDISKVSGLGWAALFHSVSAFNNAGFSIFPDGLMYDGIRFNLYSNWILILLIILGGLGFSVLQDFLSIRAYIQRWKNPWMHMQVQTRIVLATSGMMILLGAIGFFSLERNNVLLNSTWAEQLTHSVFQSVTCRTAGFNTVNIGDLTLPTLLLFMFLMFIGASPGGTGGGIKTTTFMVLINSAITTIRGKKHIEVFKRTISFDTVDKAYSIALISMIIVFVSTFLISVFEPSFSLTSLMFEVISAFGTVGLSTGITPYLSPQSKILLSTVMFVGRIGTLTLAIAFLKKASFKSYTYPKSDIMVG